MNYSIFLIQLIERPRYTKMTDIISLLQVRAKFFEKNNENSNFVLTLNIWGNFDSNIIKSYNINEFLLVEGYLIISKFNLNNQLKKQIHLTAVKIFPNSIK